MIFKIFRATLPIFLILVFVGCAKNARQQVVGPEEAWLRAQDYFNRERYYSAQTLLKDIALNYSGAAYIDSAQFLLGRTSFELEDYLSAADQFIRINTLYPSSNLAGDAAYYTALSYYEESPSQAYDQEYTVKAFDSFQRFIDEYSGHALTDSAYKYMALCREKLAKKEFMAATLYYKLQEYASAVLYSDIILADYYDTIYASEAQFLKAKCYYELKDWENARKELNAYLDKFKNGKEANQVEKLLVSISSSGK